MSDRLIPRAPYHVVWLATNACTARCSHCSSASATPLPRELTTAEAKGLVDQLVDAGVVDLGISGGEPMMRVDLLEIIEHAKTRGLAVGLASNGAKLSRRRARRLAALRLDRLQVSLDGFEPEHDALRQWPGLFQRVLSTIRIASEEGIRVHVCCTITKLNFNYLDAFAQFVKGLGVSRLNLSRYVPTGRGTDDLAPGDGAWRQIIEGCESIRRRCMGELEVTTHLAQSILVNPPLDEVACFTGCQAGRGQGCVTSDGTVFPCVLLPVPLGNIRDAGFSAIWSESLTIRDLQDRATLSGACGACELREKCGGCRAVAYARYGDMLAEDPRCWKHGESRAVRRVINLERNHGIQTA